MSKQHRFTSRTKARKRAADVVYEADQRGMGSNPDVPVSYTHLTLPTKA